MTNSLLPSQYGEKANFLVYLSERAGEILKSNFRPTRNKFSLKDDKSRVTNLDIEINKFVIDEVSKHFSKYSVWGEEESAIVDKSKIFVVDPLDGTYMFTIGFAAFGFQVAVVEDGKVVAALASNPIARRTLVAELGKGTYCMETNEFVRVSPAASLNQQLVSYGYDRSETAAAVLLHEAGANTMVIYSVAEGTALVATGGLVCHIMPNQGLHDGAPSKLLVEEAGGKVTDLKGNEQRYDAPLNGVVLTNGRVHSEILEILNEARSIDQTKVFEFVHSSKGLK